MQTAPGAIVNFNYFAKTTYCVDRTKTDWYNFS